ncbi:hypothetical protein GCM10009606_17590 [Nocardioides aquiterrae]|uniref:Uncharacterized protein n=1 Tax=Nocardioides aquiterrae TaxID=203799 RepID=A0ABN1UC12_9ACTN
MTVAEDRALLKALDHNPRLYVPGSLHRAGTGIDWTEKCRARCPHDGDLCHVARSGYLPPEHRGPS